MANPALTDLASEITNATSVQASATILINGISQRIADAVSAAISNGATAEELKPVSDLGIQLQQQTDALNSAVIANTPAQGGGTSSGASA